MAIDASKDTLAIFANKAENRATNASSTIVAEIG